MAIITKLQREVGFFVKNAEILLVVILIVISINIFFFFSNGSCIVLLLGWCFIVLPIYGKF